MTNIDVKNKLHNLILGLPEAKAVAVLEHVNVKHRVASRDGAMLFVGRGGEEDFDRFNLIVNDGIVTEIYFE